VEDRFPSATAQQQKMLTARKGSLQKAINDLSKEIATDPTVAVSMVSRTPSGGTQSPSPTPVPHVPTSPVVSSTGQYVGPAASGGGVAKMKAEMEAKKLAEEKEKALRGMTEKERRKLTSEEEDVNLGGTGAYAGPSASTGVSKMKEEIAAREAAAQRAQEVKDMSPEERAALKKQEIKDKIKEQATQRVKAAKEGSDGTGNDTTDSVSVVSDVPASPTSPASAERRAALRDKMKSEMAMKGTGRSSREALSSQDSSAEPHGAGSVDEATLKKKEDAKARLKAEAMARVKAKKDAAANAQK